MTLASKAREVCVTAETITDEEIRDYARDHWRDPWKGGGPGRGTVNDGMAIALSTSHPESRHSARAEFARLINTKESP